MRSSNGWSVWRLVVAGTYALCWSGCASGPAREPVEPPSRSVRAREILNGFPCAPGRAETEEDQRHERKWRAAKLKLELVIDHVRFVRYGSDDDEELFAEHGEACSGARDASACQGRLKELEALGRAKAQVFAITTTGDAARLYQGLEVLQLLGAIDNVDKAWLALMVHRNVPSYACGDPEWDGFRETENGYELSWVWTTSSCMPFERTQFIERVDRDGGITRLREAVVEPGGDACVVDESLIRPVPAR